VPLGPVVREACGGSGDSLVALGPGVGEANGPRGGCGVTLDPGVWSGVPLGSGRLLGWPVQRGVEVSGWPGVRDGRGVGVAPGWSVGSAGEP